MANLFSKVKRTIAGIKSNYKADKCFSKDLAKTNLKMSLCSLVKAKSKAAKYNEQKHNVICDYLDDLYEGIINKYSNDDFLGEKVDDLLYGFVGGQVKKPLRL